MSDNFKKILVAIAGALTSLVVAVVLSFVAGLRHALNRLVLPQEPKVDTLFIRDTIMSNDPVYITKTKIDSIPYPVPVRDTLWKTDTVWLQKEQVIWQDSLSRVYASGVSVEIDSVLHYMPTRIITKERNVYVKVKPKWSIGVQAGYGGAVYDGKVILSPYLGIGVTYNLISWQYGKHRKCKGIH